MIRTDTVAEINENTSYAQIVSMLPKGARVLDVGCGPGNLGRMLGGIAESVVGIDRDQGALENARPFCKAVYLVNLEAEDLTSTLEGQEFDAIVFADVLEHLRNADALLSSAKKLLAPDGLVFASIPNIAHGAVRLALLRGAFTYQRFGILDDTHIKFYTRSSIEALFVRTGYEIVKTLRTTAPIFAESDLVPILRRDEFPEKILAEVEADPDSETLQVIVMARPVDDAVHDGLMAQKQLDLAQSLHASEARYAQLERALQEQATGYGAQIATLEERCESLRLELESRTASDDGAALRVLAEVAARERDAAFRRIRALESTIESMEESLASSSDAVDQSRRRTAVVVREIETLSDRVFALQAAHASALSSLTESENRVASLRSRLSRARESERALDERSEELIIVLREMQAVRDRFAQVVSLCAHAVRTNVQTLSESRARIAAVERLATQLSAHIEEQTHALIGAKAELSLVYASKFWRLRNVWVRIKCRVRRLRKRRAPV